VRVGRACLGRGGPAPPARAGHAAGRADVPAGL